ncbi:MAG: LysR family transcriptional regulator ArgP [Deltaproteobacteria bacterium]|nr:LysR family transcriptional regulator ArgP [Deltaproteobacteria bacterium]
MLEKEIDLKLFQTLAVVVQSGSFESGAKKLGLTQSAVSHRIKSLEQLVGQAVLLRTTPVQATEVGERLISHVQYVSSMQIDLLQELNESASSKATKIAIGTNADSLATYLFDAISPTVIREDLLIEFVVDDQSRTNHLLRTGRVQGCITSVEKSSPGTHVEYLGVMKYLCVASAEFKRRYFPQGVKREAINNAPAAIFNQKDDLHFEYLRKFFEIEDTDFAYHFIPSSEGFLTAALNSIAYALIPEPQCSQALARKKLINLTPKKTMDVPLYWHSWERQPKRLRALSKAIIEHARRVLDPH